MTGGLGFIGSRLCETLLRQGRAVVCVDDLRGEYAAAAGPAAALRLRSLGAELVLTDAKAAPLRGAGGVVHLAGLPGVRTRRPYADIWAANAGLTERLVEAAGAAGARFVLGSTSSVYGNPAVLPTPEHSPARPLGAYAMTKAAGEASVRAAARAGTHALTVRLFTVYGPGQRPEMAFARWIGRAHPRPPAPLVRPARRRARLHLRRRRRGRARGGARPRPAGRGLQRLRWTIAAARVRARAARGAYRAARSGRAQRALGRRGARHFRLRAEGGRRARLPAADRAGRRPAAPAGRRAAVARD